MTSSTWPAAAGALTGALRTDGQPAGAAGVSPLARISTEFQQAEAGARRLRLGNSLAVGLDSALRRLGDAAQALAWPTEGIPFATGSRLAVQPESSRADLGVALPGESGYLQEDKLLSRGFAAGAPTSLEAGTYGLKLGFGGLSDSLSVTVSAGETNADVLRHVADAVNGSTLQVDAAVRSQTGVGALGPGDLPTGSFLALSVNRTRATSAPTLTDTSGHLAAALGLAASSAPLAPAQAGTHQLTSLSLARPTTFRSGGYDREAETSLAPGTYTVGYAVGPASGSVLAGSVDITVSAGDTWGEVLANMKNVFGSASPSMVAQLVPARRVWDSATGGLQAVVDAQGLEIALSDPKPGWRLSLSGGDNAGATDNILSTLGLDVTAQPGSDGRMVVDGRDQTRTPGAYIADQGRVVLDQQSTFGDTVPVGVLAPLETLAQGLSDVVTAYNGLRGLLTRNAELLRPGLAEDFRAPVSGRALDLKDLGLAESGSGKLLWLQAQDFVQALTDQPQAVRRALLGDGGDDPGLLPELAGKAQDALSAGAASLLLPPSAFAERDPFLASPTPRTELEIEKAGQLLDLLDSAPRLTASLDLGLASGLKSGLETGTAAGAAAADFPWGGSGVLLRRKG